MTDYAAAPSQPIAQGLISLVFVEEQIVGISFFGIGIIPGGPPNGLVRNGTGDYTLTLDDGLPGDVAIDPTFSRVLITPRASAPDTPTLVLQKSQTFLVNPPEVGSNKIRILFTGAGGTPVDSEFEIIIWRGDAGVDLVNANLIGPLFPNP